MELFFPPPAFLLPKLDTFHPLCQMYQNKSCLQLPKELQGGKRRQKKKVKAKNKSQKEGKEEGKRRKKEEKS